MPPLPPIRAGRRVRVVAYGPDGIAKTWDGLRIAAEIDRTDEPHPDSAKIRLWNLDATDRAFLARAAGGSPKPQARFVQLFAGHAGLFGLTGGQPPPLVFAGDVTEATIGRDGRDIITELTCGDGRRAFVETRMVETFTGPITSLAILQAAAAKMGLLFTAGPGLVPLTYRSGYVCHGAARQVVTTLVASMGARWCIRDGMLLVTAPGQGTAEEVILLSADTGLLAGLKVSSGKKAIQGVAMLDGRIAPRRRGMIQDVAFTGLALFKKVAVKLDSHEGEFQSAFEGVPIA